MNRGELVSKNELKLIATHFIISRHAKERISQRSQNLNVKSIIENPILAYYNTDGSINIAKDRWKYLVIVKDKDNYIIVTYKDKSYNGIDIFEKRKLALKGICR